MGEVFEGGPAISGSKSRAAHCWKYCPYSTQGFNYNGDLRVPENEKIHHGETEGQMHSYSIGAGGMGWMCADNDCPYYAGTAVTEVEMAGRRFSYLGNCPKTEAQMATASGTVDLSTTGRTIVSGTRFYEI